MNYYNQEHKKLNLHDFKVIGFGGCSTIYRNGSIIFKKYYKEHYWNGTKITEELFKILKSIHNPHLMELYDLYMNANILKSYINSKFRIDGYTAKYYEKSNMDLLFAPIDYIIDNFGEIEKLFDLLAEYYITVRDVRLDNSIIGDEYITIIDPDLYSTNKRCISENKYKNKKALLSLFNQILFKYLFDDYDEELHPDIINDLNGMEFQKITIDNIHIDENTCLGHELSRRLKPYNHLFDYMVNECKKN